MQPVLYETHMHTPLCKHDSGQPEDYAAVADRRGLKGIIVTCHNPIENGWAPEVRMRADQLQDYVTLVDRARQAWTGRVDVRLGLESEAVRLFEDLMADPARPSPFSRGVGGIEDEVEQHLRSAPQSASLKERFI